MENTLENCGGKRNGCGSAFEWHGKQDYQVQPKFKYNQNEFYIKSKLVFLSAFKFSMN
jgi:hypothetical protein